MMTWAPVTLIQTTGSNGDMSQPPIDMDPVDTAFVGVPGLVSYARARLLSATPNAGFTDDCLNAISVQGDAKIYSSNGMNGKPCIALDGSGSPPYQIGLQMPQSFTFVAVVDPGALKTGDNLFTTSASDFQLSCNNPGIVVDVDGSGSGDSTHNTGLNLAANTPVLVGVSFDHASNTVRVMLGSAVAGFTVVTTVPFPATAGSKGQPFGYFSSGTFNFVGSWSMWALFSQAYGAGGTAEAQFAAAIAAAKAHWGV